MMDAYADFLERKRMVDPATGLVQIPDLPAPLFPFQRDITAWALRRGRAALFAGTGLGKSLMELAWAQAIAGATGKPILHLAPLAVSAQLVREAVKFGIVAHVVSDQAQCDSGINVTNYQKLDHFDLSLFGGVILDESSILKSTEGHYRTRLIEACQSIPFRLAATATPAPNDFMELGNHAEFLGIMSYTDMLATFFTHDGGDTQKWRLKGHAETEFWKWMASWAVMIRKPSDLGYANDGYDLPPLNQVQHLVAADYAPSLDTGLLFPMEARTMQERLAARRDTVAERCKLAFQVVIGSAVTRLAECLGSQNTPSVAASDTSPIQPSASAGKPKGAIQSETPNTCATTTPATKVSGSGRPSSKRKSTGADASDMPSTPSSASKPRQPLEAGRQSSGASSFSGESTASNQQTTTPSSLAKADDAPSVDQSPLDFSTLITAIGQAKSEGFFAAPATPASVISKMTQSGLIEPWCIWCNLNSEQDALARAFGPLAFSVSGSMADDEKEAAILDWIEGKRPVMISKPSIMGFGMNFQHCRNTLFVGLNDSFEQIYQSIRRFWRFGQTKPVTVHFIAAETEGAVVANLRRKEADADRMAAAMILHMADLSRREVAGTARVVPDYHPTQPMQLPDFLRGSMTDIKAVEQVVTPEYAIYQGDSCELIRAIPGESIDFGIHSPPFEGLYKFSNFDRDISNNEGPGFWEHYAFLIAELLRVTKPGRLHSVHCMQLPMSKIRHGNIGMRDFRGEIVRAYEDAGWIYHSEVCIWKDPVVAQQRTKSIRLLHKQIEKDSTISGQGLADYVLTFRKPGENAAAVEGKFTQYIGTGLDVSDEAYERYCANPPDGADDWKPWPRDMWRSVLIWQRYASPVWMDINQTRTLQYRAGRDEKDEVHISPLQLDVIERCIDLWSLPGETVLTPFLGIGSEVYCAVEMGRKGVGFELKPSYFAQAVKNIAALGEARTAELFSGAA